MAAASKGPGAEGGRSGPGVCLVSGAGPALHPFLTTAATAFGRPVCRLGLAYRGDSAITPEDIFCALGRGVNFLNWAGLAEGPTAGDALSTAVASLGGDRH